MGHSRLALLLDQVGHASAQGQEVQAPQGVSHTEPYTDPAEETKPPRHGGPLLLLSPPTASLGGTGEASGLSTWLSRSVCKGQVMLAAGSRQGWRP